MTGMRKETDSLGTVEVPADKLWGAQTQRSLEHFSIGKDLIPREMITAYATLKKSAAIANRDGKRLDDKRCKLIVQTCDEILAGRHHDMFPLHVWMTGSGTQFNMNVNEVISNRCSELAGTPLGSHAPVHPNDHVNMAQSSNDSFPSAMSIAAAVNVKERLIPAAVALRDAIAAKSREWDDIIKIGRTHMQDATPLTLGQEWSGYAGMLSDDVERLEGALSGVYRLALGGTAVGTGINSAPGFAEAAAAEIAKLTGLPFVTAPNKFAVQGAHDALVHLSGTMRTLAVSLYKIANDIRLMSCGPRAGFAELKIPENEPGSSIMPGKVNPTQCEALAMIAVQVMANDVAVGFGGAGGYLEMNVYKPLIIFNIAHSTTIMSDGCVNFRRFLIEGTEPNRKKINEYVERSLMLVTALSPVIGYDKASKIAHYAMDNDLTLKAAALKLGFVSEAEFDRVVDPKKMVKPYVAAPGTAHAA
ncbi:MAG: class II fumarate hydratase [Methylobacteriaceae bacterium]|nr:class II fumarate hydratase [Methylobacteriaceae bacterium]